jgi:hypothetical protein
MKEKIKKYWWVIAIALLIGGSFYWFQWRPSQIRKDCQFVASHSLEGIGRLYGSQTEEERYKDCLRQHGLEK